MMNHARKPRRLRWSHRLRRSRRAAGLTLVELLLGLAITSIIALAAGGMLSAVSYGATERTDMRSLLIRQELVAHRLAAAVRSSRLILDRDEHTLVLWTSDRNNDQVPQLSEVRWVELDADTGMISSHEVEFPQGWTQAQREQADRDYVRGSSRMAQTSSVGSHVVSQLWADQVSGWSLSPNALLLENSTLLSFRVTLDQPGHSPQTMIGAAALRSQ